MPPKPEIDWLISSALKPPQRIPLDSWIEEIINLPSGVSAVPGKVELWPFQRGIAEVIGDPLIERVSLVKPVRVGFTTLLTSAIGHFVANDPAPILIVLPTENDCSGYLKDEIEPIFEATPELKSALETNLGKRDTMLARRFPGGSMRIVPARAPRNLRRLTARILLLDEVDGMEITSEGDPITLAERRTLSFRDRKIVLGSTPVFSDTSPVLRAYRQSDQRVFEVPCPECEKYNEILWENIVWDTDKPDSARYKCPNCEGEINEFHKTEMVKNGRWRATKPEIKSHAGFRLNALISPLHNARWEVLVAEFIESKKSPETLQTFINTILGQGWTGGGEEIDIDKLESRAEPFSLDNIPREVRFLTAGVDVQIDRLELVVAGWDRDNNLFVLDQDSIWGSPHESAPWQFLDSFLNQKWKHPLGGEIGIDAVGIDAGDGNTMSQVLDFTQPRRTKRVFAVKGQAGNRPVTTKSKAGDGRLLFIVGVDNLKSRIHSLIAGQTGIRFSNTLEGRFYEELGSEKRQIRYKQGRPIHEWVRIGNRPAESLDCLVYSLAVRNLVFGDPGKREIELRQKQKQQTHPGPGKFKQIRSNWMSR